jgi:hypothetical protein
MQAHDQERLSIGGQNHRCAGCVPLPLAVLAGQEAAPLSLEDINARGQRGEFEVTLRIAA